MDSWPFPVAESTSQSAWSGSQFITAFHVSNRHAGELCEL
jgi:hypothetical protein